MGRCLRGWGSRESANALSGRFLSNGLSGGVGGSACGLLTKGRHERCGGRWGCWLDIHGCVEFGFI